MSKELEKVKVLEVKEVAFNNVSLLAIKGDDGFLYAPVSRFCNELGIDANAQMQRIKRDEILSEGSCIMHVPTNGTIQDTFCLQVDLLPTWLAGIKSTKCKEEVRPLLLDFKKKASRVLAATFIQKEETKEPPKVFTASELILQQAQVLVNLEKTQLELINKTNNLENKIIQFEEAKNLAQQKLWEVSPPDIIAFQKNDRAKINELVKNFGTATGITYSEVFNKLYVEFGLRYHFDLKKRAKNQKNKNALDIAEELFKMKELFAVAYELFSPKKIAEIVSCSKKEG